MHNVFLSYLNIDSIYSEDPIEQCEIDCQALVLFRFVLSTDSRCDGLKVSWIGEPNLGFCSTE